MRAAWIYRFPFSHLGNLWKGIFPFPCPLCGKNPSFDGSANMFCRDCLAHMPMIQGKVCRGCGSEIDGVLEACSECLSMPKPPWRKAHALFRYTDEVRNCIHRLKYQGQTELVRPLGRLASGLLDSSIPYDCIIPIPLHWTRRILRGYNQSELFAEELSRQTGIPVRTPLRRIRATKQQAFLTKNERNSNIAGAFCISDSTVVQKRTILLTDDVMTTGATLREAAGILFKDGAERVDILVIARRQRN